MRRFVSRRLPSLNPLWGNLGTASALCLDIIMQLSNALLSSCKHCGEAAPLGVGFCCAGCESVYGLLFSKGLGHFYDLQESTAFGRPRAVPALAPIPVGLKSSQATEMKFYLDGIHCLGCLWLLEKLPEIESGISASSLDIAKNILRVKLKLGSNLKWPDLIQLLASFGYPAKPIVENEQEDLRKIDQHRQLARLGISAFCAGNVMLLSVSIYAGAGRWWSLNFGWLSLLISLPSLTYSGWPIYRSALLPLRRGILSADLAIAIALLAGAGMSFWSLLSGSIDSIFFDSLTMLIFLLLSSRTILARFQENLSKRGLYLKFLSGETYFRLGPPADKIAAEKIEHDDLLKLNSGQTLPTDSSLLRALAFFDLSLLTGETKPVKFLPGEVIDAGARLISPHARVRVIRPAQESRLANILSQAEAFASRRSPAIEFADRMGRWFVLVVLALATLIIVYLPNEEGAKRALALVIVTCPCVLAFAIPLAMTKAMQILSARGVLIKATDKLEALAKTKHIYFDKTGTLTTGQFTVKTWEFFGTDELEIKRVLLALELNSQHPIAKSIRRSMGEMGDLPQIDNFQLVPGSGVKGTSNGQEWSAVRLTESVRSETHIGLFKGSELQAKIVLGDSIRPEARQVVASLHSLGIQTTILSGDSEENTEAVARAVGICDWHSRLLPESKADIVAKNTKSIMVGDGANDAVAFQGASVGVAMQGAMEIGLQNADVMLTTPGLESLLTAIQLSRKTMRIIRGNFAITLGYNIFAGWLALTGLMQPFYAAVLMPVSALSVFLLTEVRCGGRRL
jgi:Cu+-exporting ATPase